MLGVKFLVELFFGETENNTITVEEPSTPQYTTPTVVECLEEDMKMSIAELGGMDIESAEAAAGSKVLENKAKALSAIKKAEAESEKVRIQKIEAQVREKQAYDQLLTKLVSIGAFALVTIFWIFLEQGMPLPRLLVKLAEELVAPRRL